MQAVTPHKGKMVKGGHVESLLEAQAQITGDIAYEEGYNDGMSKANVLNNESLDAMLQQGKKEIVEWLGKREVYVYASSPMGVHLVKLGMSESWQKKLKEVEL